MGEVQREKAHQREEAEASGAMEQRGREGVGMRRGTQGWLTLELLLQGRLRLCLWCSLWADWLLTETQNILINTSTHKQTNKPTNSSQLCSLVMSSAPVCGASLLLCGGSGAPGPGAASAGWGTAGKGPQKGKIPGGKPGSMPGATEQNQNDTHQHCRKAWSWSSACFHTCCSITRRTVH